MVSKKIEKMMYKTFYYIFFGMGLGFILFSCMVKMLLPDNFPFYIMWIYGLPLINVWFFIMSIVNYSEYSKIK